MNWTQSRPGRPRAWIRLLAVATMAAGLPALSASRASADGNFHVACGFSHRNHDDPIVFPRIPGSAHLHHYFGSRDTDAFSTVRSMRNARTTCAFKPDTSGYWAPALRRPNGKFVRPDRLTAYYWGDRHTQAFPNGLKMLAGGDTHKLKRAGWACGEGHAQTSRPKDCGRKKLRAVIVFPSCWDGARTDSSNHRGHMSYPVAARCGTKDHPVKVPKLVYHIRYPVRDGRGFTLSSGNATTLHGDFWNTWHQRALKKKVRTCLHRLRNCRLGNR
jgi:hypothetical protein